MAAVSNPLKLFQAGGVSRCLMMGPGLLTSVSAPGPIAIGAWLTWAAPPYACKIALQCRGRSIKLLHA